MLILRLNGRERKENSGQQQNREKKGKSIAICICDLDVGWARDHCHYVSSASYCLILGTTVAKPSRWLELLVGLIPCHQDTSKGQQLPIPLQLAPLIPFQSVAVTSLPAHTVLVHLGAPWWLSLCCIVHIAIGVRVGAWDRVHNVTRWLCFFKGKRNKKFSALGKGGLNQ